MRLSWHSGLGGRTIGLLGRTTGRVLGKTLTVLASLALKLGVTRRLLLALIGVVVVGVLVLVVLATGLFG